VPELDSVVRAQTLSAAAAAGDLDAVECISSPVSYEDGDQDKPDFGATDADGRTPLMLAAMNGHLGVVRELCFRPSPLDAVDSSGRDAVALAREAGHEDCVKEVLGALRRRVYDGDSKGVQDRYNETARSAYGFEIYFQ
jgi:ankyrin repeat protein